MTAHSHTHTTGFQTVEPATGDLPRIVTPNLMWTGGCLEVKYKGGMVHGHFTAYVIKGEDKTLMVDSGHPAMWHKVEEDVERFLDGRPLDYMFLTHIEYPHAGLVEKWLDKYPNLVVIGDMRDARVHWPQYEGRFKDLKAGEYVELGPDRKFYMLPAVWRDITNTLWGFDTKDRVLFVSDAFSFLHLHKLGECDMLSSEHSLPDLAMIQFYNERALQWTRYSNVPETFADIDTVVEALQPRLMCAAHGSIIDTKEEMVPYVKHGMASGIADASYDMGITRVIGERQKV